MSTPYRTGAAVLVVSFTDAAVVASLLGSAASRTGELLIPLLAVHVGCALAAGALLARKAPSFVRSAPRQVALFVTVIAFFVPVLGPLGAMVVLRSGLTEARPVEREPWLLLEERRGAPCARTGAASAAEIRTTLRARTPGNAAQRFAALLATRHLSGRAAVPLLALAQTDPLEELRLYAFSRLEVMRRALEQQTEELTAALDAAAGPGAQARLHLRLAECYWELGYQGLAEGTVLEHALQSADDHAALACELQPAHAPALFFHGRILVHRRVPTRARSAFERAMAAGYPRARVLPYLAECAFHERELGAVTALLRELELTSPGSSFFRPVLELWRAPSGEAEGEPRKASAS